MDLQQLRYFTAVATHGSISAAALVLGVTQPTISQALQGLEHEMHTPLFSRLGRGMVLTSAGFALLGPARRVLRASAAARDSLRTTGEGAAGRLDIAIFSPVLSGPVPRLLARFLRENRDVNINVRSVAADDDIVRVLAQRQSDVAFTRLPSVAEPETGDGSLRVLEIGLSQILFVEPERGDDDTADGVVPQQGRGETRRVLAPPTDPMSSIIRAALSDQRPHLPPVVADKRETRLGLVSAGVGATYLNATMADIAARAGMVASFLDPPIVQRVALVYDPTALSDIAEALVAFARHEGDESATARNASAAGGR